MNKTIHIGKRDIGPNHPVWIIAEAGVNHFGKLDRAFKLVDMAVEAGADVFKTQVYKTENMISAVAPEWQARMKSKEMSYEDMAKLFDYCEDRGIQFLASAHDLESVDFLEKLGVLAYKIGSGEKDNPEFLKYVGRKGRPVILSTGMHTLKDVRADVEALSSVGCKDVALLHCTTLYPTEPADVNLRALDVLRANFPCPIGYSDHTIGTDAVLAAVARDACIIEKHIALERDVPNTWDPIVSCDARELKEMVRNIRKIEQLLGAADKKPVPREKESIQWARKSIVAKVFIPRGTVLTEDMLCTKRPGKGIPPSRISKIVGKRANVPILPDTPISSDFLSTE